ncbi:MAG: hypothetical protein ACOCXJ_08840 [Planctomycetota bacterium]
MTEHGPVLFWLLVLAAMAALAPWRRRPPSPPPAIPTAAAEEWMLRALPGIGPKTAPAMTAAVRAGRLEELPASARGPAERVFVVPAAR